jgi:hypothetical protein
MTNPDSEVLLKLAERCEAASGPDRTLDALIAIALDPGRQIIVGSEPGRFPQKPIYGPVSTLIPMAEANGRDAADFISAPLVTASLDAAMTLVPPGEAWCLDYEPSNNPPWVADLTCFAPRGQDGQDSDLYVHAATPALALTAAALRALSTKEMNGGG